MSALHEKRRRALMVGTVGIALGLLALVVFSVFGIQVAKKSKAGKAVSLGVTYHAGFPYTPTGLIGVVDDSGALVSLAILTVDQSGVGGTMVIAAPMADAASGTGDVFDPLDRVYSMQGATVFAAEAELMTRLSFDVIEVMTPSRFAELIAPLSKVKVDLPLTVHDSSSKKEWASGSIEVDPQEAAAILTARDPEVDDYYYLPDRSAVWAGVAGSIGDGVDSGAGGPAAGQPVTTPGSMDELWRRLISGPVEIRSLVVQRVPTDLANDRLDPALLVPGKPASVVAHDRAEMISIFAAIASGRIGAPNAAARLRIVSSLSPDEVAAVGPGWDSASMWKFIIDGLLFGDTNVVSIDTHSGLPVPEITQVEVLDGYISDEDRDILTVIFGEFEAVPISDPIQGVNATVVLGKSFLQHIAKANAPTFPSVLEPPPDYQPTNVSIESSTGTGAEDSSIVSIDGSQDSTISDSSATVGSGTG